MDVGRCNRVTTVLTSTTEVEPTGECPGGTLESDTCRSMHANQEVKRTYDEEGGGEKDAEEILEDITGEEGRIRRSPGDAASDGEDAEEDREDAATEGENVECSEYADNTKQAGGTKQRKGKEGTPGETETTRHAKALELGVALRMMAAYFSVLCSYHGLGTLRQVAAHRMATAFIFILHGCQENQILHILGSKSGKLLVWGREAVLLILGVEGMGKGIEAKDGFLGGGRCLPCIMGHHDL
ncbi:hypothetical protein NDU88_009479 [Pleurodeles waltl]|uniref:Uncharacterized protein n=1 Tax=Pleurodeles waltl TaxID=8319 RepID=A0AAV7RWC7_PLEWA|nr:hypothetical protein NDU88_009479 [Pleurodeles waltl]